jgi:polysaccharide chain length determinant protein (PEP-CTERM system associated)
VLPGRKYLPEDFLRIAIRRKWLILVPLVVVSVATVLVTRSLPDEYRSETTILVVPQRVPESYVRSTVTDRIGDRLQSLKEQILSRTRLERIILDLNLNPTERSPSQMEDLVGRMRGNIKVETVRGDAFTVSYVSRDPQTAQVVAERLALLFIKENVREREVLADGTSEFLQVQLDEARGRLIEQEKKLEEYRLSHAGELPTQASSNLQALQNAGVQLQAVVDATNRDLDRRSILDRQLADLLAPEAIVQPSVPPDSDNAQTPAAALTPGEELVQARARLQSLEARLTADHPDVRRLRKRAAQLEQQIAALPAPGVTAPAPVVRSTADLLRERRIRDTRSDLEALNRRIQDQQRLQQRLRDSMAQYQARLEAVPIRESELIELTRDSETLQQIYSTLLAKREDSKIAANLERQLVGEQFRVLDKARVPERPFSPNRVMLNGIGVLLGLFIGVAIVGVLEFSDATLKTEEDIRIVLGLPVIATIPILWCPPSAAAAEARGRRWTLTAAAAALVVVLAAIAWSVRG